MAKAARWDGTDAEARKRGEQTGLYPGSLFSSFFFSLFFFFFFFFSFFSFPLFLFLLFLLSLSVIALLFPSFFSRLLSTSVTPREVQD